MFDVSQWINLLCLVITVGLWFYHKYKIDQIAKFWLGKTLDEYKKGLNNDCKK